MLNSEVAPKAGKVHLESKYYIGILNIEREDSSHTEHSSCNSYKGKYHKVSQIYSGIISTSST